MPMNKFGNGFINCLRASYAMQHKYCFCGGLSACARKNLKTTSETTVRN